MNRRQLLGLGGGLSAGFLLADSLSAFAETSPVANQEAPGLDPVSIEQPFSEDLLKAEAKRLASEPFQTVGLSNDAYVSDLNYDQYRAIRFKKDAAIWRGGNNPFSVELFHTGYIFDSPVEISVVEHGQAKRLDYHPGLFTFGPGIQAPPEGYKGGFSGFRIHGAINQPGLQDEFVVFQGASYFRSKTAGQDYGLSARGLAINTAQPPTDEFPTFKSFWLEKPATDSNLMTVFALLDSVSVAGVYKFVISNLHTTIMDVDCTLFPRKSIKYAGIAPLTSMFYFAPSNPLRPDEARQRVHDSDGLAVLNGKGEALWRPLTNGARVQFSSFVDNGMRGFGLLQRERRADRYQDFDARYEARPTVWVEPKGDWGEGSVDLVELPSANEYFDNIVAYWQPENDLEPGQIYEFNYRLHWGYNAPVPLSAISIRQTLVGASTQHAGTRLFYIDFEGTEIFKFCDESDESCSDKLRDLELKASKGTILNVAFRKNPISGGHRLGFEYRPEPGTSEADIRCALIWDGKPVSEIWIYRWAA